MYSRRLKLVQGLPQKTFQQSLEPLVSRLDRIFSTWFIATASMTFNNKKYFPEKLE